MNKLTLTLLASAALAAPAMAQTSSNAQPSQAQQAHGMSPRSLSRSDIRRIQISLNRKGFDAGHVDGVWGRGTGRALMEFQRHEKLNPDGRLTAQTISDLGVNLSSAAAGGASSVNQANGQNPQDAVTTNSSGMQEGRSSSTDKPVPVQNSNSAAPSGNGSTNVPAASSPSNSMNSSSP